MALSTFWPALTLLSNFLHETTYAGHIGIFSSSSRALAKLTDYSVLSHQHLSLEIAHSLDTLLHRTPNITLRFLHLTNWENQDLVGFDRTQHLVQQAITNPGRHMGCFRSANYHRAWLKVEAVRKWEAQYHETPHTSHVYTHVL